MGRLLATVLVHGAVAANLFVAAQGKELWSSQPATTSDFIRTAYLLGNGKLGGKGRLFLHCAARTRADWLAMPLGAIGSDYVNLNVDSLWSGGPFENSVRTINFFSRGNGRPF